MRWVVAAVLGLAVACGGGGKGSKDDTQHPRGDGANGKLPEQMAAADAAPQPLDHQKIDLGTSQAFIPLLRVGAEELGCSLVAEQPDPPGVAYQCEEGTLFAFQEGTFLHYTCQNITKEQCNALLDRINKKVLELAGGE